MKACEGKKDRLVQLIHKHVGVRDLFDGAQELTGVEEAAEAIMAGHPAQRSDAKLREALKNMLGAYDTPVSRRRYPPDEFMQEAIKSARDALAEPLAEREYVSDRVFDGTRPVSAEDAERLKARYAASQSPAASNIVSLNLMQRVWQNLYYNEDDAGGTFQQTLSEVVDWLAARGELPDVDNAPRRSQPETAMNYQIPPGGLIEQLTNDNARLRAQVGEANSRLAALNLCEPHFLDRKLRELDQANTQVKKYEEALSWLEDHEPGLVEKARDRMEISTEEDRDIFVAAADEIERLRGQVDKQTIELNRIIDYCTDAHDDEAVHMVALLRIHEAAKSAITSTEKQEG